MIDGEGGPIVNKTEDCGMTLHEQKLESIYLSISYKRNTSTLSK